MTITEPGIYDGMPNEEYHQQPALSASGMKLLIEAPAKFKWERDNPTRRLAYDFGSVWHALVLGDDASEFVVVQKLNRQKERVPAGDYDTQSARDHREEIYAAGKTPILKKELDRARVMADAFKADPLARRYMDLDRGSIEQSAFWQDERTGLWLRCRFDFLPDAPGPDGFDVVDVKSAATAEPGKWLRDAATYGYAIQDALYRRAVAAMGLHHRPGFVFLAQEKTAPYIVTPVRLAARSRAVGDILVDRAIDTYIECQATGEWPGYVTDIVHDDLPEYFLTRFEDDAA